MKSFSYIIILMSLIGNCPSAKAFCVQNKINCCSENNIEKISHEEVKQFLKDFNFFISKYQKDFQKQNIVVNSFQNFEISFIKIENAVENQSEHHFKIQNKTSKVRNKDDLLS